MAKQILNDAVPFGEQRTKINSNFTEVYDGLAERLPEVANYAAVRAISDSNLTAVYVRGVSADLDGGAGIFRVKIGDTTSADNGGTILVDAIGRRWLREYTGHIKAAWAGLTGSGDDSAAMAKAVAACGAFGTIEMPAGTFAFNLDIGSAKINLIGQGIGKTIIKSYAAGGAPIIIGANGTWDFMLISDMTICGDTGTRTKIGVQFGHSPYQSADEYAGRVIFERVKFFDLDKCVARPHGNIGVYFDGCYFSNANFHVWSKGRDSNDLMHAGCLFASRCHFDLAHLASFYIDSAQMGTGQIVIDSCIFEGNPGMLFFVKNFNDEAQGEGFEIRNTWNEANCTAGSVTIDGVSYTPKMLHAENVPHISINQVTMGPTKLVNSNLGTKNCQLDAMTLDADAASSCFHDDAVFDSGKAYVGTVRSIKNMNRQSGNFASSTVIQHRQNVSKAWSANVLKQEQFGSVITFFGSVSRNSSNATDGVLPGQTTTQDILINSGELLLPSGAFFSVTAGKYYVWYLSYKLISGVAPSFSIAYDTVLVGGVTLNGSKWTTVGGMTNTVGASGLPANSVMLLTGNGTCTLRLGVFAVVEFSNKQDAIEFLNSTMHAIQ